MPRIIEDPSDNDASCEGPISDNIAELDDTATRDNLAAGLINACKAELPADTCPSNELRISSAVWDDAARWRQSVLRLLAVSC